MHNYDKDPIESFDSFEAMFRRAEERPGYWEELAKLEFTEEMLARMQERGLTKGQLANALGVQPAFVSRLVSGQNNFTLRTMVRIARALHCEFRSHLQRPGTKACWIDVLKNEPQPSAPFWPHTQFNEPQTIHLNLQHETLSVAA